MGIFFQRKLFEGQIKSIYTPFYFHKLMHKMGGMEADRSLNPKIDGEIKTVYEMPSGLYVVYSDCSSKKYKTAMVEAFGKREEVLSLEKRLTEEIKVWAAKPESEKQQLWNLAFPKRIAYVKKV